MSFRIYASVFIVAVVTTVAPQAYGQNKADRATAKRLKTDIIYLSSDYLQGRRTSTEGERKAAEYLQKRYKEIKVPAYNEQYSYPFHFVYGKEIADVTGIKVGGVSMRMNADAWPLPFSASRHVKGDVLPDVMEQGNIWLLPCYADRTQAADAHFNTEKYMYERAKECERQGASGVLFFDGYGSKWPAAFNKHSEYEALGIPVGFINYDSWLKNIQKGDTTAQAGNGSEVRLDMDVTINKAQRIGTNLAAYIDNKAPLTVVLGAHYDHLGYGEDENSLQANAVKEQQIHHGADDNASGTAAILELAKWVKSKKLKNFNYLFVNFSGEELGLFGSKAFVKEPGIDSAHIAFMINLDMIGRLNDSTRSLTLGGVGTSPAWQPVAEVLGRDYKLTIDSSGTGPSDHTSFYNAGIPVLFFFTGAHKDYHKPTDTAGLINYTGEVQIIKSIEQILTKLDKEKLKPVYTVTKQKSMGRSAFKVTMGIMPDYTYQDGGVRVDGVSDNRPAAKAGVKQGDIIIKLGDIKISGMQSYMEALGKFTPGDNTQLLLRRDGQELLLPLEFSR